MKVKLWMIVVLFIIACAAGFFVWKTYFSENDQEIIGRRMQEVTQMLGKSGTESYIVQLEHARTISKYFDDICDIRLPKFHKEAKMSREQIEKNIITARNWTNSLELKIYDLRYEFQESDPKRCKVSFTGMLDVKTKVSGSFQEGYDLEMNWVKKDREWLIEGIGFSEILNK